MKSELVQEAVDLFIETLPLETTDIETESYKWHDLYSKECNLYVLMGRMTDEESNEYRIAVKYIRKQIWLPEEQVVDLRKLKI